MKLVRTIKGLRDFIQSYKNNRETIGFVPTMGFLHRGHQALIEMAKRETDKVVVSSFVNPKQFNREKDLEEYPVDLEKDTSLCQQAGVDILFLPSVEEMYPNKILIQITPIKLSDYLCGTTRPGFFEGICLVVLKLFNMVQPDFTYFGEKDAQQLAIIKQLVSDLNFPVVVRNHPTVREKNGLAISSRNKNLTKENREQAGIIYQSLLKGLSMLEEGMIDAGKVKNEILNHLSNEPHVKVDYLEIVDTKTFQPIKQVEEDAIIAIAIFFGFVRLIDNVIFEAKNKKIIQHET